MAPATPDRATSPWRPREAAWAGLSPGALARRRRVARQLVEMHRLEQSSEPPELSELNLHALLRTVCGDYPAVKLSAGGRCAPILSDSRHLTSVLFAVIDNALLHGAMPVGVTLFEDRIVVADAGRGFRADLIGRATERFVTGAPLKGVGLGLALAAAHAELIGVALELRNLTDGGAQVSIRFRS